MLNLINLISEFADETYGVIESNTLFPGLVQDFYNSSPTMEEYMTRVRTAEADFFGKSKFISPKVKSLIVKSGDLNHLTHLFGAQKNYLYESYLQQNE
jgi:hypothetical protein